jgi:hypothetical protein
MIMARLERLVTPKRPKNPPSPARVFTVVAIVVMAIVVDAGAPGATCTLWLAKVQPVVSGRVPQLSTTSPEKPFRLVICTAELNVPPCLTAPVAAVIMSVKSAGGPADVELATVA